MECCPKVHGKIMPTAARFVQHTSGCCTGSRSLQEPPLPVKGTVKVLRYQIENNEMAGACSTFGGEERCIQGFGGEP
jgi:hypothetical protein